LPSQGPANRKQRRPRNLHLPTNGSRSWPAACLRSSFSVAAAPPAEAAPEETLAPSEPPVEEAPAEPPVEEPPPEPSLAQPEAASTQEAPLAEAQAEEEAPALSLGAPSSQAEEGQVEGLHEPGAEAEAPSVAETPPAVEEQAPAVPAPEPAAPPPAPIVEPAPAEPEAPAQVAAVPAAPLAPEPGREPAIAAAAELLRRSFYLQLGAYSTRGLADKLARELSSTARYTVAVLPVSSGNRLLYKVLIGPLNRDESGTLLFQFRARGFKDAFVQYVE
jgi:cell division septation protein DedD